MNIQFKKLYYNKTETDKEKQIKINPEKHKMYQLTITNDYFTEDKHEATKQAIDDLRKLANELEQLYNRNQKALDSWDSIEK